MVKQDSVVKLSNLVVPCAIKESHASTFFMEGMDELFD